MKKRIMCLILLSLTIILYGCGGTDSVANQSADSATAPAEEIKAVEDGLTISKDVAEEGDRIWYVTGRDETEVETGKDDVFGKNSVVDAVFIFNNNNNVTLFDYDSVDEPLSIIEVSQMTDDEILDILEQRYAKTLGKGQFHIHRQIQRIKRMFLGQQATAQ